MIKEINKDVFLLKMKSIESTKDDIQIGNDLLDTLKFHQKECVGMAANMIGVPKRIIAFLDNNDYVLMYNPYIIAYLGNYYETMEGCLSLEGKRKAKRNTKIKVGYQFFYSIIPILNANLTLFEKFHINRSLVLIIG